MSRATAAMSIGLLIFAAPGAACAQSHSVPVTVSIGSLVEQVRKGQDQLFVSNYAEAEYSFKEALKTALRSRRAQSTVIDLLNSIGVSLHGQGRDAEAVNYFRRALTEIPRGSFKSVKDKRRGKVLSNLALAYSATGKLHEAMQCCEEAMQIFRKAKVSALEESTLLNTYGRLLMDGQSFVKAEKVFADAVLVRQSIVGNDRAELISPMINLSGVLLAQGKLVECEQVCNRAIEIGETKIGFDTGLLFPLLINLARVNSAQSHYKTAQRNMERAIGIAEKSFGNNSLEVMASTADLSELYEADGERESAEKALTRALEVSRIIFGPQDAKTVDMTEALADLYESHGRTSEAERLRFLCRALRKSP